MRSTYNRTKVSLYRSKVSLTTQFGFQFNLSSTETLVVVTENLGFPKNEMWFCNFFDIKKAIDAIEHERLLFNLEQCYIRSVSRLVPIIPLKLVWLCEVRRYVFLLGCCCMRDSRRFKNWYSVTFLKQYWSVKQLFDKSYLTLLQMIVTFGRNLKFFFAFRIENSLESSRGMPKRFCFQILPIYNWPHSNSVILMLVQAEKHSRIPGKWDF